MKRAILLLVAAGGALAVQQRLKAQQAERDLWAEVTDRPTATQRVS